MVPPEAQDFTSGGGGPGTHARFLHEWTVPRIVGVDELPLNPYDPTPHQQRIACSSVYVHAAAAPARPHPPCPPTLSAERTGRTAFMAGW